LADPVSSEAIGQTSPCTYPLLRNSCPSLSVCLAAVNNRKIAKSLPRATKLVHVPNIFSPYQVFSLLPSPLEGSHEYSSVILPWFPSKQGITRRFASNWSLTFLRLTPSHSILSFSYKGPTYRCDQPKSRREEPRNAVINCKYRCDKLRSAATNCKSSQASASNYEFAVTDCKPPMALSVSSL
jgi:hypothetical protein